MKNFMPLNAIRAFAVVGRLLSFRRAADELRVTASAVSHHIKSLEEHLGVSLLRREGNRVGLTAEGRNYLKEVSEGLTHLSRATRTVRSAKGRWVLKISAPLSLTSLWLMPRITRFTELHPEIAISISAGLALVDLREGQYNLAIRYTQTVPAGFRCDKLSSNELFPVCSPALLRGHHPLRKPSDLRHHTLIESTDEIYFDRANPGWQGWLQAAKIPDVASARYLNFSPRCLMQQAAMSGLGVGLSRTLLAADSIARGELVLPFGPILALPSCYYLICPESVANQRDIAVFRDWVIAEAEASRKKLDLEERVTRDIRKRNSNAGQKNS